MRSRIRSLRTMMVAGAVLVAPFAAVAAEPRVAPLDTTVAIENVRSNDVDVRGTVVNRTGDQLENVRLIVADKFLWHNERHPGENSPGDAHDVVVPGPIPPHGTASFEFRRPSPLPDRRDGEFTTEVSAVELTRRPVDNSQAYVPRERYPSDRSDTRTYPTESHPSENSPSDR